MSCKGTDADIVDPLILLLLRKTLLVGLIARPGQRVLVGGGDTGGGGGCNSVEHKNMVSGLAAALHATQTQPSVTDTGVSASTDADTGPPLHDSITSTDTDH